MPKTNRFVYNVGTVSNLLSTYTNNFWISIKLILILAWRINENTNSMSLIADDSVLPANLTFPLEMYLLSIQQQVVKQEPCSQAYYLLPIYT